MITKITTFPPLVGSNSIHDVGAIGESRINTSVKKTQSSWVHHSRTQFAHRILGFWAEPITQGCPAGLPASIDLWLHRGFSNIAKLPIVAWIVFGHFPACARSCAWTNLEKSLDLQRMGLDWLDRRTWKNDTPNRKKKTLEGLPQYLQETVR